MNTGATAIASLIKDRGGIEKLTLAERATALICLYQLAPESSITNEIFTYLNDRKYKWLKSGELGTVALAGVSLHLVDHLALDGKSLAAITSRLVASEVKPGGPYKSRNEAKPLTNARILQLAASLGIQLPVTKRYVSGKIRTRTPDHTDYPLYFALNFPSRLLDQPMSSPRSREYSLEAKMISLYAATENKPALQSAYSDNLRDRTATDIAMKLLSNLAEPARSQALDMWSRIDHADSSGEISNLVHFFHGSLVNKVTVVPQTLVDQLGALNMLTWVAYSLYDDIIDGDADAHLLPTANIVHRLAYRHYLDLFPQHAELIDRYFDSVDLGNAWEMQSARAPIFQKDGMARFENLPNYMDGSVLAQRALGHTLGVAIVAREVRAKGAQIKALEQTMTHYLISKQIADDLYDWQEDLNSGRLTFVVTYLLNSINPRPKNIDRETLTLALRTNFSESALAEITQLIISYLDAGAYSLERSGLLLPESHFAHIVIDRIKEKAVGALSLQSERQKFRENLKIT